MPVVTSVQSLRGGRIAVDVDGERVLIAGQALVARWRLFVDRELSPQELADLRAEGAQEVALADAHRLLAHRSRSRRELMDRLLGKGHPEDVVAVVLERLADDGLLDDRAFAAAFVTDKRELAGWGRQRIAAGLASAGVPRDVTEEALGDDDADDELERALDLLRRGPAAAPPFEAARRRAFDKLRRRGFAPAVAYAALDRWSAEARDGGGEAGRSVVGDSDGL